MRSSGSSRYSPNLSITWSLRLRKQVAGFLRAHRRPLRRQLLCCVLVINLFVWPGLHITLPDLSRIAAAAKSAATAPFDDVKLLLKRLFSPRARPQETAA